MLVTNARLRAFERYYAAGLEEEQEVERLLFVDQFPIDGLRTLRLSQYAIGLKAGHGFCYGLEQGTKKWAYIFGATAFKFGIYFGATGEDTERKYRYTTKFAPSTPASKPERAAFRNIRAALLRLVDDGENQRFEAIDSNPISQMLKAKLLSLYFPKQYINICSRDRLREAAAIAGVDATGPSEIQFRLIQQRKEIQKTKKWPNLRFTAYLLWVLDGMPIREVPTGIKAPAAPPEVDFDALNEARKKLGKASEKYAKKWERQRLHAIGLGSKKIEDRTNSPGYGYDFQSFSSAVKPRYIEVKTARLVGTDILSFHMSLNQKTKSASGVLASNYYFYLVLCDGKGKPHDLRVYRAKRIHSDSSRIDPMEFLVKVPAAG